MGYSPWGHKELDKTEQVINRKMKDHVNAPPVWTRPVPTQGLPVGQLVKNCAMGETWVRSLAWEDALEKGTATHYSFLAWRIQRTLQSVGHREVETTERPSLSQHTAVPLTLPLASPAQKLVLTETPQFKP